MLKKLTQATATSLDSFLRACKRLNLSWIQREVDPMTLDTAVTLKNN